MEKETLIKLLITLQVLLAFSMLVESCSRPAHAADTGIGTSAYRMADALERIAKNLENYNRK